MAAPEISGGEPTKSKVVYAGKTLIDLTEDTVTPATLKSGVTAHDASGARITGTLDTTPPKESDINFWDYDGTLLYSWTLAELATKTELPPLPSHDGLVCQGWNWTLQDIKDAGRELDIGALYITDDGKTRIYVDVDTETWDTLRVNFNQSAHNGVTINWGDGTAEETVYAWSNTFAEHAYAASGRYMISMLPKDGSTMSLGGDAGGILGVNTTEHGRAQCGQLVHIEIGEGVRIVYQACFMQCPALRSITIPQGVPVRMSRLVERCQALKCAIIPQVDATQTTWEQACYFSTRMRVLSLPKGAHASNMDRWIAYTSVRRVNCDLAEAQYAVALNTAHAAAVNGTIGDFSACRSLLEVTIPADATTFIAAAFQGDNALRRVTCLGDIASIPAQVFQRCYPLRFVDFTHCTAVPTLANVNAFDATHAQLEIRVPASLADAWKAATNWSSLAEHIVGV